MPLYELTKEAIKPVETTRFAEAGRLRNRCNPNRQLRRHLLPVFIE